MKQTNVNKQTVFNQTNERKHEKERKKDERASLLAWARMHGTDCIILAGRLDIHSLGTTPAYHLY